MGDARRDGPRDGRTDEPEPGESVRRVPIPPPPAFREAPAMPEFPEPPRELLKGTAAGRGEGSSSLGRAGRGWSIAMDFVFTMVGGAFLGWLVDRWLKSMPLWTMVGLGVGFVGAFVRIVRAMQRENRS